MWDVVARTRSRCGVWTSGCSTAAVDAPPRASRAELRIDAQDYDGDHVELILLDADLARSRWGSSTTYR